VARLTSLIPNLGRLYRSQHLLPLWLVAIGCAIGQATILTRHPLTFQLPDSPSYISLGFRLVTHLAPSAFFDPYRTPGYPSVLALIGALQGSVAGEGVVYAQAVLMVITAFELYALTFGLTSSRIAAGLAGILFATNVRLLDWERLVMTEALAIFLVTTIVLAFWLWLRNRAIAWAVLFCVASGFAILTRPSLLYLPLCLALVVVVADRRRWRPLLLMGAAIYLPVAGYGFINDRLSPHAGLSAVSNINLLGKVLEYDMQGEGDSGRFLVLWQGINGLSHGDHDPYNILKANSAALGANYQDAAAFSEDIIRRHPIEYLTKSAGDLVAQWLAVPYAYIPPGNAQWFTQLLAGYGLAAYAAYPALPLAIAGLVVVWQRLDRQVALGTAAVLAAVVGGLVTNALSTYVDFARLRTPIDALAFVGAISVGTQLVRHASSARSVQQPPTSG
jgi:Dolichyl-phosphate-mannose-protein mannosyltransferase